MTSWIDKHKLEVVSAEFMGLDITQALVLESCWGALLDQAPTVLAPALGYIQ